MTFIARLTFESGRGERDGEEEGGGLHMLTYGLHACSPKANKFSPFPSLSTFFPCREEVGKERRSHRSSSRNFFCFFRFRVRERKK